jgi:ubiquinone/menaquinone biosynthesis C-methylase UbiE
MAYDVGAYWSRVAAQISQRGPANVVAGDDDPYYRYKRRQFLRRFLQPLNVQGRRVLELGCGPGGNLRELAAQHPATLIGCDISTSMLALAKQAISGLAVPVQLTHTDGQALPLPDRSVDLAVTVTVLQHDTDGAMWEQMIAELCRVTAQEVVVMEDTAPTVRGGPSWLARPVAAYRTAFAGHGFQLAGAIPLNLRASRWVHERLRRALIRPDHREGEPLGRVYRAMLAVALLVTRWMDKASPDTETLTQMRFRRSS